MPYLCLETNEGTSLQKFAMQSYCIFNKPLKVKNNYQTEEKEKQLDFVFLSLARNICHSHHPSGLQPTDRRAVFTFLLPFSIIFHLCSVGGHLDHFVCFEPISVSSVSNHVQFSSTQDENNTSHRYNRLVRRETTMFKPAENKIAVERFVGSKWRFDLGFLHCEFVKACVALPLPSFFFPNPGKISGQEVIFALKVHFLRC